MTRDEILALPRSELAALAQSAHRVDAQVLAGFEYAGISLGLPKWVEQMSWKTFVKAFYRDTRGAVRGFNVRIEQHGVGANIVPKLQNGVPHTFGHFEVVSDLSNYAVGLPLGAVMLVYGRGKNGWFDPIAALRDPLVSLQLGSADRLLGWSYVSIAGFRIPTPSYFLLERSGPLSHLPRM